MPIFLILALASARAAMVTPANPLYSAYCAALLEHQRPVERELMVDFERALERVVARANVLATQYPTPPTDDLDERDRTPMSVLTYGRRRKPANVVERTYEARSLQRIPDRVREIQTQIASIKDGVVASGLMIVGQDDIQSYVAAVRASTRRNDRELMPVAESVLPYVTNGRIALSAFNVGTPLIVFGALARWILPSAVNLDLTLAQALVTAAALPAAYVTLPLLLDQPYAFAKGLTSDRAKLEYEDAYGRRALATEFNRLDDIEKFARRVRRKPSGLLYYTYARTLSETDTLELKHAAAEARAPGADFVERQERPELLRDIASTGYPVRYDLLTDQISYYDRDRREPVLLIFTRFVRNVSYPSKPRDKREDKSSGAFDFGGLRPAGI